MLLSKFKKYGSSTLSINSECEVTDPEHGKARYLYEGNLPPGYYKGELEISGGSIHSITKTFIIKVVKEIS